MDKEKEPELKNPGTDPELINEILQKKERTNKSRKSWFADGKNNEKKEGSGEREKPSETAIPEEK